VAARWNQRPVLSRHYPKKEDTDDPNGGPALELSGTSDTNTRSPQNLVLSRNFVNPVRSSPCVKPALKAPLPVFSARGWHNDEKIAEPHGGNIRKRGVIEWKRRHPGYEKARRARNPEATQNSARRWRATHSSSPVMALVARQVFRRERKATFYQRICCVKCHGRRFYFRHDELVCRRCFPASGFLDFPPCRTLSRLHLRLNSQLPTLAGL
jgi:hypothetical protein